MADRNRERAAVANGGRRLHLVAGGANTEMEMPLYRGLMAAMERLFSVAFGAAVTSLLPQHKGNIKTGNAPGNIVKIADLSHKDHVFGRGRYGGRRVACDFRLCCILLH